MKKKKWTEVEPAEETSGKLPAGGYVAKITKVEDVPTKEYLWIEYDIAEGEYAGHYSDEYAQKNPYIHRFARSYKESAENFFSAFLQALEISNRGKFSVAEWQENCDEQDFVGLEIGIVVQNEQYTNDRGDDKERLNVEKILAAQDIRNGDYTLPPEKDSRTQDPAATTADDDTPF